MESICNGTKGQVLRSMSTSVLFIYSNVCLCVRSVKTSTVISHNQTNWSKLQIDLQKRYLAKWDISWQNGWKHWIRQTSNVISQYIGFYIYTIDRVNWIICDDDEDEEEDEHDDYVDDDDDAHESWPLSTASSICNYQKQLKVYEEWCMKNDADCDTISSVLLQCPGTIWLAI